MSSFSYINNKKKSEVNVLNFFFFFSFIYPISFQPYKCALFKIEKKLSNDFSYNESFDIL